MYQLFVVNPLLYLINRRGEWGPNQALHLNHKGGIGWGHLQWSWFSWNPFVTSPYIVDRRLLYSDFLSGNICRASEGEEQCQDESMSVCITVKIQSLSEFYTINFKPLLIATKIPKDLSQLLWSVSNILM